MKDQTIITLAILSLFTMALPSANADTSSSTASTEHASSTRIDPSKQTEASSIAEESDAPVYAESLKKDEIIEKHKHHVLLSTAKRRPWL